MSRLRLALPSPLVPLHQVRGDSSFLFKKLDLASYIGRFESGKVYPDFVTGIEMIRLLELDPGEIISQIFAEAREKGG